MAARAFEWWKKDFQHRKGLSGKLISLSIGLFVLCCACSIVAGAVGSAAQAIGLLPTPTPGATSTSTPPPAVASAPTAIAAPKPTVTPLPTSTPSPSPFPTPTEAFSITLSVVRIGDFDIAESIDKKFSFSSYAGTALTTIDSTIDGYRGGTIAVPFKKDVEVELQFTGITLKPDKLFSKGSYFEIIPEPSVSRSPRPVMIGKLSSEKIENGRAIALINPWVHVPYGDGGTMRLMLYLKTEAGTEYRQQWIFEVEKNN
jgi:hypothetical protein